MALQKKLVLDCSLAVAWCFPDEKSSYPQSVLDSLDSIEAVVPSLWPLEVANVLLVGERRKRNTQADTSAWLTFLKALPIRIDEDSVARAWNTTIDLARAHSLSEYDASYLELALRLGAPLASLDDQLKRAASAVEVAVFVP